MADRKISQFDNGGAILPTDEIATNRGGVNTKVFVGSAAALDTGVDPDQIPTNADLDPRFSAITDDIGKVLATDTDTIAETLINKLFPGTNVAFATETDSSGSQIIRISASPGGTTIPDGDYGDIEVSDSGSTFTINDEAVTYAKIQDVASNSVLGRKTSGSGIVEEITVISDTTLATATSDNLAYAGTLKTYIDTKVGQAGILVGRSFNSTSSSVTASGNMTPTGPTSGQGTLLISASITPKDSSNKILGTVIVPLKGPTSAGSWIGMVAVFRGSTLVGYTEKRIVYTGTNITQMSDVVTLQFEDSPSTTSSVTYTVRIGLISGFGGAMTTTSLGTMNVSTISLQEYTV